MGRRGAALLLAPVFVVAPAVAQVPLSTGDKTVVNYAFATQLGSGVYSIEGRTIQVYRLPLSYMVRPETAERWGVKVNFPLTFGFLDFEPRDVLDTGLPQHLDTVSLVPGVELRVLARANWLLRPFIEAGIAKDRSGEASAGVASGGLRSLVDLHGGEFDIALGNALTYARVAPQGEEPASDFVTLDTSVEARHLLGIDVHRYRLDYGLYASIDLYFDNPDFPLRSEQPLRVHDQYEIGVTFGTRPPIEVWRFELPRLGVGYRFGSDASAFRFVIGIPAPALSR